LGHRCDVVAPTLIPRKAGDRVKHDRRDAMSLAQNLRAGHLTEVWVPDEAHEAMRELVRLQALAKRDIRRARQQLLSFLLRHGVHYPGRHWSRAHRRWLSDLSFEHPAQHLVLEELVQRVERAEMLGERIEHSMVELLPRWTLAPVVEAVQALRGISILNAITLIAEIGSFSRFENPRQLMAYLGLPSAVGAFERQHNPARTDYQDRQKPGAHLPGRGGLDLPLSGTGVADHSRALRAFARADPGGGVEGAGQALPTLSPPDGYRQGGAQGGHRHRPRTGRLHLGHRPHGRAGAHLIEHLQRHQPAKEDTRPENTQRG
jgi:hypothetical protein